ncbi:hypothetical protein Scep_016048 [Stephania cephalantha]|uniref:Peroxidase n=1 Tax=Stephania cephalantha TaxID=152367 RepID=A0AAP0NU99_9MAGN
MVACQANPLTPSFYDKTCPKALPTIRNVVNGVVSKDRTMAASLMRLHFHDCFVQGCDASLLLADSPKIQSEQNAFQNFRSLRGFEVIDTVKSEVEKACPGVVSCADILAVVARDATVAVGGPTWNVKLGRRDSTTASQKLAEQNLPTFKDDLNVMLANFKRKGLNARDMVALSGSHTIGQAHCATFRYRLYTNVTKAENNFKRDRMKVCPISSGEGNTAPLDYVTPNEFDTNYFKVLMENKGILHTDQVLYNGGSTDAFVVEYSKNKQTFFNDFGAAMVKMGDIAPLTGSNGQIRRICRVPN